jgi:methylglutaconyl-CoA hydratase
MTSSSAYKTIRFEERDRVARVILDRPDVRNAFNNIMISEVADVFREINSRKDLRVVVLTGEGESFCAGADLNWMKDVLAYTYEENLEDSKKLAGMFHLMFTCPLPTIARVNGPAIGGGCGMAAVCDIVIASDKATFSLSEVKLGLVPACISPYVIRRMGDKNCREYFLTGERMEAGKARESGLVNEVVPADKLDEAVNSRVSQLLSSGPDALAWCKQLLAKAPDIPEDQVGNYTAEVIARLRMGDEGQEGMRAFFEKRKPKWSGG